MHIDLRSHHHEAPKHKRAHPLRVVAVAVGIIFFTVLVAAVPVVWSAYHFIAEARAGKDDLAVAQARLVELDVVNAAVALEFANGHFAKANASGKILKPLEVLPYAGRKVRAARMLVAAAEKTSAGLGALARSGATVFDALVRWGGLSRSAPTLAGGEIAFFKLTASERSQLLQVLADDLPKLREALLKIDEGVTAFNAVSLSDLPPEVVEAFTPALKKISDVRGQIAHAIGLADLLFPLAGYGSPKQYLVLFQNDTELRPTGGFIGTVGILTIENGELKELKTQDSYALDSAVDSVPRPAPPEALVKYLGVHKWYLRDSNWSPDFRTSAQMALGLYNAKFTNTPIDGVVAIDTTLASDLLKIIGNIKIGDSLFTPANVTDELEYQVEKGFDKKGLPVAQRKDILVLLSSEVFRRIMNLPSDGWRRVSEALLRSLEEKHALLYSPENTLATLARAHNWDGALYPVSGDSLMVVDANLAAYKTDSVLDRSMRYSIAPSGDRLVATVTMRYRNNGAFNWKTTRYRSYTRILAPLGSEFISVRGALLNDKINDPKRTPGTVTVSVDSGRQSFGAFIAVEPGETRELTITYRLPKAVSDSFASGSYTLTVQKQPGTNAVPLTLDLLFGKNVERAEPAEVPKEWGDARYKISSDLRTDKNFQVVF